MPRRRRTVQKTASETVDALQELEHYIASLDDKDKANLDALLRPELESAWLPDPRNAPQVSGFYSQADMLLYGGAAGSGKTALLVGLALTQHKKSVIFRSKAVDLRGIEEYLLEVAGGRDGWNGQDKILRRDGRVIELGHLEKPGSERSWQGRPHDLIGFDEGAQLSRAKVQFVMGWLRSTDKDQRTRVVIASNPPTGGEGEWLMEWFAPWLDPQFSNPAKSGELRYAATAPDQEGTTVWLDDASPIIFTEGRNYRPATDEEAAMTPQQAKEYGIDVTRPMTRTFIPGKLEDNPYLRDTGYRAQLQAMPEPLRSQMLHGDFLAGREDHEWQVIPSAWVKAAQERWTANPPQGAHMSAIAADVAQGGGDNTVLSSRHGPWFSPLIVVPGVETPRPSDVAGLIVRHRRNGAVVVVDVGGGYGGGVKERLEDNDIEVRPFNGAGESSARSSDKQLRFVNARAEAHWRFREALDPDQEGGAAMALPPDPTLFADLTSVRWKLTTRGIQIESKEELKKPERLGRSPDRGDAVIMAWSEGEKAIVAGIRKNRRAAGSLNGVRMPSIGGPDAGTGWMSV